MIYSREIVKPALYYRDVKRANSQNPQVRLRAVAWTGIEALSLDQHEYRAV
jgi:hypothetical protein